MTPRTYKMAAAVIEMGSPQEAGRGIADIVKFLLKRINQENRQDNQQGKRRIRKLFNRKYE
jgi:hypothetical protein